jgi:hypothetical protein
VSLTIGLNAAPISVAKKGATMPARLDIKAAHSRLKPGCLALGILADQILSLIRVHR